MKRRDFLKMLAALGAVPSLGMLKPAPRPDVYLGHAWSADFYVTPDLDLPDYSAYRKILDEEIMRALEIPMYEMQNTKFLAPADPNARSWWILEAT